MCCFKCVFTCLRSKHTDFLVGEREIFIYFVFLAPHKLNRNSICVCLFLRRHSFHLKIVIVWMQTTEREVIMAFDVFLIRIVKIRLTIERLFQTIDKQMILKNII